MRRARRPRRPWPARPAVSAGALVAAALAAVPPAALAGEEFPVPAIPWNPARYDCRRAPEPPAVDGRLDEPAWRAAAWTGDFTDIEGPARPAPRFRTRVRMLWDDACLYVGAELEEPHVWGTLAERDAVIYHDNDFEVFLDPDGDHHLYYELEINALGTVWDLLLVRPYRDGGPAVNGWDVRGLRAAVAVDGTLNDPSDVDRGWTVELAFPWPALAECAGRPAPPAPGDQWRMNFSRVEWKHETVPGSYRRAVDPATGNPYPEANWVWSPQGLVAMHYPEMWGVVRFSAAPPGAGPETIPPADDEPARRALMLAYYAQRRHALRTGAFAPDAAGLGLAPAAIPGWSGPVVRAAGGAFEAVMTADDGRALRVDHEGRLR